MAAHTRKSLEHYLSLQYRVEIDADPEGGYVAVFPDLPGCATQGETLQEAAAMADEARGLWIETEYSRGRDIPEPSLQEQYSGKFNVRIPRSLHRALAASAEREGVSLNQYVLMLLARGDAQAQIARRLEGVGHELRAINEQIGHYQAGGTRSNS
jgi:predicted RNase H-like HicB family nuclease